MNSFFVFKDNNILYLIRYYLLFIFYALLNETTSTDWISFSQDSNSSVIS